MPQGVVVMVRANMPYISRKTRRESFTRPQTFFRNFPEPPLRASQMKVLIVATKAPWPPVDGGRFLLRNTLEALTAAGHRPVLVAPVDPARFDLASVAAELAGCCEPRLVPAAPGHPLPSALRSWASGMPLSVARHALPAVRREVERCLAGVGGAVRRRARRAAPGSPADGS